jgi:hypothetical protein
VTGYSDLPPQQRIGRYKQLAKDAEMFARRASGEVRDAYLLLAQQWQKLADDLEDNERRSG